MNSVIADVTDRKERPAYARFETRVIEDRIASVREGRFVGKDIDFVLLTPPYSIDVFEQKTESWFKQLEIEVIQGRMLREWADKYREQYEKWKQ